MRYGNTISTSSRNTRDSQPPALCASSVTGAPSDCSSTDCSAAAMRSMYLHRGGAPLLLSACAQCRDAGGKSEGKSAVSS